MACMLEVVEMVVAITFRNLGNNLVQLADHFWRDQHTRFLHISLVVEFREGDDFYNFIQARFPSF